MQRPLLIQQVINFVYIVWFVHRVDFHDTSSVPQGRETRCSKMSLRRVRPILLPGHCVGQPTVASS